MSAPLTTLFVVLLKVFCRLGTSFKIQTILLLKYQCFYYISRKLFCAGFKLNRLRKSCKRKHPLPALMNRCSSKAEHRRRLWLLGFVTMLGDRNSIFHHLQRLSNLDLTVNFVAEVW